MLIENVVIIAQLKKIHAKNKTAYKIQMQISLAGPKSRPKMLVNLHKIYKQFTRNAMLSNWKKLINGDTNIF